MEPQTTKLNITSEVMRRGALGLDLQEYVDRELHRFYAVLKAELKTIDLSVPEMDVLVHAKSSAIRSARIDRDSTELEELAEEKGVNGKQLAVKVTSWTPGQTMAVLDACERYWFDPIGGKSLERALGR